MLVSLPFEQPEKAKNVAITNADAVIGANIDRKGLTFMWLDDSVGSNV